MGSALKEEEEGRRDAVYGPVLSEMVQVEL